MNTYSIFSKSSTVLLLMCSILLSPASLAADSAGLSMAELSAWLDAYGDAWESRDADKAANLFAEDSTYQVTPYEDAHTGQDGVRQYWAGVTAGQRNVVFEYQALSVTGSTGIAHWSASFAVGPDDVHLELDGIFVLKFDANGKCTELREWWHLKSPGAEGNE